MPQLPRHAIHLTGAVLLALIVLSIPSVALAWNPYGSWPYQPNWYFSNFTGLNGIDDTTTQQQVEAGMVTWDDLGSRWESIHVDNSAVPVTACDFPYCQNTQPANEPAVTFLSKSGSTITSATVYFNTGDDPFLKVETVYWENACPIAPNPNGVETEDVQSVALHEFRHVVGLDDLYPQQRITPWNPPDSIMGANCGGSFAHYSPARACQGFAFTTSATPRRRCF